jgi:hypothetical protein
LEACNRFLNVLLWKDTQVQANKILMITELQASRSIGDALIMLDNKQQSQYNFLLIVSSQGINDTMWQNPGSVKSVSSALLETAKEN